jgi:signal peptidase II
VRKWWLLVAISTVGVLADQATKYLAVERLTTIMQRGEGSLADRVRAFYGARHLEAWATEPHVVWKPVWRMRYAENPGAAWGLFRGLTEESRTLFFGFITVGAVAFILVYYRKVEEAQRLLRVALSLVLAGAVGNFIDRLARGYVIDFVDWHWWNRPDLYWPTFNLADSMIVVGVGLLLLLPAPRQERAAGRE